VVVDLAAPFLVVVGVLEDLYLEMLLLLPEQLILSILEVADLQKPLQLLQVSATTAETVIYLDQV
jgi:hypothetical protein